MWNVAEHRPVAQHSYETGFSCRPMSEMQSVVDTNGGGRRRTSSFRCAPRHRCCSLTRCLLRRIQHCLSGYVGSQIQLTYAETLNDDKGLKGNCDGQLRRDRRQRSVAITTFFGSMVVKSPLRRALVATPRGYISTVTSWASLFTLPSVRCGLPP